MWSFYDELCTGIPSGIRIEGCVIGQLWTTVRANGSIGVARTLGDAGADRNVFAQSMIGTHLRDAANWMKWDSLLRACVGVAAMNAFYNCAEKVSAVNVLPDFLDELSGKTVTIIGDLSELNFGWKECGGLTELPLPENSDLGTAYDEALRADLVFISGDALTNQTLPALLKKVGADTKVSLAGVSVPAAPVLFAFGNPIHNISGVYAKFDTTVEGAARQSIADLTPGVARFSLNPVKPARLHESAEVKRNQASPYRASKFNSAFTPWAGKDYDQSIWSPLFKG